MQAHLDVHGVKVRLSADHPFIFETLLKDLAAFRVRRTSGRPVIRLDVQALPPRPDGKDYPRRFHPYRETALRNGSLAGRLVTRYMTTGIAVITDPRERRIHAAVVPEPSLLPDPAYHYLFTQPINPWLKREGLFFLHAGCVAEGRQGVLFIGHPRSGKSTLTLSAVRAGFRFLSDEQPLLSLQQGIVLAHNFPRRIRLDPEAAALFPGLKAAGGKRLVFPIDRVRAGCHQSSCRPSLLVFPRFQPRGKGRLSPLRRATALAKLLEDDHFIWYKDGPMAGISKRHFNLFEKLVNQAPAYALDYTAREIHRVPSLLRNLLAEDSGPCHNSSYGTALKKEKQASQAFRRIESAVREARS